MIYSEELSVKLQELKGAETQAEKSRLVRECIAIYRRLMCQDASRTSAETGR